MPAAPRAPSNNSKAGKPAKEAPAAAPAATRITAMALVPNEQHVVFTGTESGVIYRHRRGCPAGEAPLVTLTGHAGAITGLSAPVSGDEVTSCSLDGTIKVWSAAVQNTRDDPHAPAPKRCLKTIQVGQPIRSMYAGPSGDLFYCGTVRGTIVRVEGGKVVDELVGGHCEPVTAVAVSESGALLSGSLDGSVVGWDLANRAPVYVFKGQGGHVRAAAVAGSNLYTLGSNETFCCYAVPADFTPPADASAATGSGSGSGAADSGDGADGGDGPAMAHDDTIAGADATAAASGAAAVVAAAVADETESQKQRREQQQRLVKIGWVIKPSAKIQLPWLPTSIAIIGNFAVIGTSARIVASINIRVLASRIAEYGQRVEASIVQAEKKLRKQAAEKKKAAKKALQKAVRAFRNEHGGGDGGDDGAGAADDAADDDDPQYDDDGNVISPARGGGGGGDHSAAVEEFERQQQQELAEKVAEIDTGVTMQVARFGRLRNQFFVQHAAHFITSAMCDIVPGTCADSVFCVAGEGAKVYAASGTAVEVLALRPGVRAV